MGQKYVITNNRQGMACGRFKPKVLGALMNGSKSLDDNYVEIKLCGKKKSVLFF